MKNKFRIVLNVDNVGYEYNDEAIQTIKIPKSLGSDIAHPSFGLVSQTSTIVLIDKDKTIFNILNANSTKILNIEVYLNDNLIAYYLSDSISYSSSQSILTLSLKDDLIKLSQAETPIYALGGMSKVLNDDGSETITSTEKSPLSNLVDALFLDTKAIIGEKYYMEMDDFTRNAINGIYLNYGYLKRDTYWANWNKICHIGLLKIYLDGRKFVIRRVI